MTKQEILKQAKSAREQEVLGYQINIDNYRLAIQKIGATQYDEPLVQPMQAFRKQLEDLLATEIVEQTKAQVMLDVVTAQLETDDEILAN